MGVRGTGASEDSIYECVVDIDGGFESWNLNHGVQINVGSNLRQIVRASFENKLISY